MALRIIVVRHGRTLYNEQHLLQGWCDSPLTAEGLAGVAVTAGVLAARPIDAAYASPLGRTVATAREILRHHPGVELLTDARLKEYNFGDLEEQPEAALEAISPADELYGAVLAGEHPGLPGGESAADYLARVGGAFADIEARHADGETVLVVSHGLTLMAWLIGAVGVPPIPLPNASITTVDIDTAGRRLVSFAEDPSGMGQPLTPTGEPYVMPHPHLPDPHASVVRSA